MILVGASQIKRPIAPPDSTPGPAVVVLLRDRCPCVTECRSMLNALAEACRGRIRFVGLVDAEPARSTAFAKEAGLHFPLIPDPRSTAIRRLKGRAALDLRLVGDRGILVGGWHGLSRSNVAALVDAVRRETGQDVSLSLAPFTELTKFGCDFSMRSR